MSLTKDIKEYPLASIIIPTYNSEKTLEKCLESIKNQTYKNIEAIIVDKCSEDNTAKIAKVYTDKVFVINAKERGEQKNYGIKKSNGEYICLIDSDMELTPKAIEECINLIESDKNVGGICILVKDVGESFWVKCIAFERELYKGTFMEAARFLRKDLVEEVGGIDNDIVFLEEFTLPQKIERLGYNVRLKTNSYITHHFEEFSLIKFLKKKYYYGKTAWKYVGKYKEYGGKQISPLSRFGLFFKNKEFYSKPLLALGVVILKSLEYASAGAGCLVGMVGK